MTESRSHVQKVTISLPTELLAYADAQAQRLRTSRSQFISQALAQLQARDRDRLAAEGYGFYAAESKEFAEASGAAFAETLVGDGQDER